MGTIYGYWTCDYCGVENRGDKYRCDGCGKTRGKDVEFYIHPKQSSAPNQRAPKSKGPDWYCAYCDSLNSAAETKCRACGHERDRSSKDYFTLHPEEKGSRPYARDFADDTPTEKREPTEDTEDGISQNLRNTTSRPPRISTILGAIGIIALIIVLMIVAFPYRTDATILDKTWERSVTVEQYRTFHESDWYVPAGGRETDHYLDIHHYEQVLDHYNTVTRSREVPDGGHYEVTGYTNNGDGTFDEVTTYVTDYRTEYYTEEEPVYRSEPVYQTKYEYDIERWAFDHTETTSGHSDEPYYATPESKVGFRTNGSSEHYEIVVSCNNRFGKTISTSCSLDYNEWASLNVGDTIPVKIYAGGIVSRVH